MPKFLLVTDLDHTLVGDDFALAQLNDWMSEQRQSYGAKLVYCTGRSCISYEELRTEAEMLDPDILIASVGTEIYQQGQTMPDVEWSAKLTPGWDRDAVMATTAHFLDLVLQEDTAQRPFKVSFLLTPDAAIDMLPQLEQSLCDRGLDVQIIYSSNKDLDILPRHANKGAAMTFVRQQLGFDPMNTIVCGDSGNDVALFESGEECGVIVGNAQPELLKWHRLNPSTQRYLATGHCAAGMMEGLKYFGFK